MRVYCGSFSDWSDVLREFQVLPSDVRKLSAHERLDLTIASQEPDAVFAAYDHDGCDGQALVIFLRDGTWYVVEAAHCSCYGLEDRWDPDPMPREAILRMAENASRGLFQQHREEITAVLESARP